VSITIPGLRTARSLARHAGKTPTQLKTELDQLADDNAVLTGDREDMVCALTRAGIRIGDLEAELAAAVAEVRQLQRRVWRDAANVARLRQAVINARPRITVVDTQLVRPFAPEVALPYVSPVPVAVLPQQRRAS
jgi:hypothetical protein